MVSVQDLRPDPQDKPTFYLENIYQLLADPNRTRFPTPLTLPNPSAFSPPKSAIWVNSLWSLSLVITLSCALLAMLLQQWARRYIEFTQSRSASSPHQEARIRAFFDKGVKDLHLRLAVDALPILLHASIALFLAGLLVFVFRIGSNHTVFQVTVSWVGLCTVIYAYFTLLPIFRHESPYHTPLSSPLWLLYTGTLYVAVRILRWLTAFNCCNEKTWDRFGRSKDDYQRQFFHGIDRVAKECARKSSSEIDSRILLWTLQFSDQDHKLEQLFASIPGFCNSRVFNDLLAASKVSIGEEMADALIGLMSRTLSSDLLPQSTKQSRIMICDRAMAEASLPINPRTLSRVLYNDWSGLLDSVEFGLMLRKARYTDPFTEYYSQCVISVIVARVQEHDDRWFELATSQLRISKSTLENYLAHGDSMLLANCVFMCRRTMEGYSEHGWRCDLYSRSKTLELVSRFDVQDTLPELQHEFCVMWNDLVRNTGNRRSRKLPIYILKHVRNVYYGLHQGTVAAPTAFSSTTSDRDSVLLFPQSYPLCTIARHRPTQEPSPEDVPSAVHDLTSVATSYTPRIITAGSESHRLQPVLPFPETFGGIQGDARTHATSFSPNITPHSTYAAVPRPPSYLLRKTCDRRTEAASNTSDATASTTAWGAHTPSASSFSALHHSSILETFAPLDTRDASHIPTSSAGHVGIAFADMQSVDNHPYIPQQCISVAPPARAVLRDSPVKDDRRLTGLLADITHGTTSTSAFSTTSSIPDVSGAVSTSPHSHTATSSSIGTVTSGGSGDLQIVPARTVLDTPSPSFPVPVLGNTIPAYSQSSPTSSMSQSDDIPSGKRPLATSSATALHPSTSRDTTVPPQQRQSAAFFPAITSDFPRPGTSYSVV